MKLTSPRQKNKKTAKIIPPIPLILLSIVFVISLPIITSYTLSLIYLSQGDKLVKQGKLNEAINSYKTVINFHFKSAPAQFKLAQVYQKQNQYLSAFEAYQKAFLMDKNFKPESNFSQDLISLASKLEKEHYPSEAIWCYEQVIKLDPNNKEVYEKFAKNLAEQSRWDEAIEAYKKALEFFPENWDIHLNLAKAYNEQQEWERTIVALEKVRQVRPDKVQIYPLLGKAYQEREEYDKALEIYLKALTYSQSSAEIYHQLGQTLEKQQKITEAIAAYQKAQQLDPKNGEIDRNICLAYHQQGELKKAINYCRQAFRKNPTLGDARFYAEEVERGMIIHNNPEVLKLPERIPSPQADSLIHLKRAVVKIIIMDRNHNGVGTGWLLKKENNKAWIVTNRHVVTNKEQKKNPKARIFVEFYSEPLPNQVRQRRRAKLIKTMPPNHWLDLAVLEIDNPPKDIQPLSLGSALTSLNQPVQVIGNPVNNKDWTVSKGTVREQTEKELILSIMLASGQSGSPVLNPQEQVIGVVSQAGLFCSAPLPTTSLEMSFRLGCGLAIPIEQVKQQLQVWQITK